MTNMEENKEPKQDMQKKLIMKQMTRGNNKRGEEVKRRIGHSAFTHLTGIPVSFHCC